MIEKFEDAYFDFRNRVLSNPKFQRIAAKLPGIRSIAAKRASTLFDLCAGFVYSQILHASVKVGLLESLREGPTTIEEIAAKISLSADATRHLLDAACGIELVERRSNHRYALGVHGASLIGNPSVMAMIEHHALLYRDLADPVALLRGDQSRTELNRFWSYAGSDQRAAEVAPYSALMTDSLSLIAEDILDAYPIHQHRRLLDIGGGEGAFIQAVSLRAPNLSLALFDLPAVADRARDRQSRAELTKRAEIKGGNVFSDALPEGADVVSLVRVIHDHDDAEAVQILRAAHRALARGGVLLLAEPMAATSGAQSVGAYFEFYLLAMGQGKPRTAEELRALVEHAGFARARIVTTSRPMLVRLLVAKVL